LVLLIRHNIKKWIRYRKHDVRNAHGRPRSLPGPRMRLSKSNGAGCNGLETHGTRSRCWAAGQLNDSKLCHVPQYTKTYCDIRFGTRTAFSLRRRSRKLLALHIIARLAHCYCVLTSCKRPARRSGVIGCCFCGLLRRSRSNSTAAQIRARRSKIGQLQDMTCKSEFLHQSIMYKPSTTSLAEDWGACQKPGTNCKSPMRVDRSGGNWARGPYRRRRIG
jgi:hypothetical protein